MSSLEERENRKITLTLKELEDIKRQERNNTMSETKGHYKMSDETKTAINDLKEFMAQGFDHLKEAILDLKEDNYKEHSGIMERQDKTNGNVKRNTSFRLMTEGQISLIKWLMGFLGFSSFSMTIVFIYKFFVK